VSNETAAKCLFLSDQLSVTFSSVLLKCRLFDSACI